MPRTTGLASGRAGIKSHICLPSEPLFLPAAPTPPPLRLSLMVLSPAGTACLETMGLPPEFAGGSLLPAASTPVHTPPSWVCSPISPDSPLVLSPLAFLRQARLASSHKGPTSNTLKSFSWRGQRSGLEILRLGPSASRDATSRVTSDLEQSAIPL